MENLERFEQACTEHSKKCERMALWAFTLMITLFAASQDRVIGYIRDASLYFYIAILCFVAVITYSYYTYMDRVTNAYVEIKDRSPYVESQYRNFTYQVVGLLLGYIYIMVWLLNKTRDFVRGDSPESRLYILLIIFTFLIVFWKWLRLPVLLIVYAFEDWKKKKKS